MDYSGLEYIWSLMQVCFVGIYTYIYLLSLENKMKTPYRKLTMKTGLNEFEIFDILSIAVKIWRQKSWKSRCTWVAESSRIGIFHRKWTQSKMKWFSSVTFIFLNQSCRTYHFELSLALLFLRLLLDVLPHESRPQLPLMQSSGTGRHSFRHNECTFYIPTCRSFKMFINKNYSRMGLELFHWKH